MAAKLPVWGIDVGQCSLKAMKLQSVGDGVEIMAVDLVEHASILSQAETEGPAMIRQAIATFLSRNNIRDSQMVVAVPGQQTLTRFTKMPPVDAKKIPDMVKYEASQQIPFDMDEVVWDYQVFTGADSPDVEVGIFAIRKELIRNHLAHFTDQGIEPIIVQTSPMASYNAARFESEPGDGKATILLDMGALATDLIIFEGNRIWSRPVPIGGNRFTEALVAAFKISFAKAEKLKRSAASSKYARQVFQAMRPVFADLVSEVQRSIGFYTSTHRETHVTRVLGMGNAFKLPGLQKFLQQNLQIEVEKISGFKKVSAARGATTPEYAENVMSYGVALGLALQGLGFASVEANLLPVEIRRSLLWRKKQWWFGGAAACLALSAVSLWSGNMLAGGQIEKDLGSLRGANPQPVGSVEEAMEIVARGASSPPLEWAARVAGAAETLKARYSQVSGESVGDEGALKRMAGLTKKSVFIPRIYDVFYRAFTASQTEEVRAVKTSAEYQKLAKRIERPQRAEVWITEIKMLYSSSNPEQYLTQGGSPRGGSSGGKPGWAVRIRGCTTVPTDAEAAKLLEEKVIPQLNLFGKAPDRGFHFAKIWPSDVKAREDGAPKSRTDDFSAGDEEGGGRSGRGGTRTGPGEEGRGIRGGRGGARPPGGEGPRVGGPVGDAPPGGRGRGLGEDTGIGEQLSQWEDQLKQIDPLTGESIMNDRQFVINVIIFKENTPQKDIPKEYQGGAQDGDQGKISEAAPAEPPVEERPDL